jgi:hypothetical protein
MTKNDSGEIAVRSDEVARAYRAILDGEAIAAADPEAMSRAIVERIMAADTFEEAFRPQTLEPWREAFPDTPVRVLEFHLNPSGFEQGSSVYAVVDLVPLAGPHEGETHTVTCGGRNVLTQLVLALEKGWLDKPVKLTTKGTSEGYTALWLVDASA